MEENKPENESEKHETEISQHPERNEAASSPNDIEAAVGPDHQALNMAEIDQLTKQFGLQGYLDEGIDDLDIDNLDEILECSDDLMDIEQTAFMGSSKIMLKMIDNMLHTIDQRIDVVNTPKAQGVGVH